MLRSTDNDSNSHNIASAHTLILKLART